MKVGLGQGSGPRTVTEARGPWAAGSVGHGGCQVCRGDETRDAEEAGRASGLDPQAPPPDPRARVSSPCRGPTGSRRRGQPGHCGYAAPGLPGLGGIQGLP